MVDHNGNQIIHLTVLISTSGNKILRRVTAVAVKELILHHQTFASLIK